MSAREEEKVGATLEDNGGTDMYRAAPEGISDRVTYKLTLEFEKLVKQRTNKVGNHVYKGAEVGKILTCSRN